MIDHEEHEHWQDVPKPVRLTDDPPSIADDPEEEESQYEILVRKVGM